MPKANAKKANTTRVPVNKAALRLPGISTYDALIAALMPHDAASPVNDKHRTIRYVAI
jgi:hypothetical protein